MENLEGKVINNWRLNSLVSSSNYGYVYQVNLNSDSEQKYYMTILCNDRDPLDSEKTNFTKRVSFKASTIPTFSYYDSHCFPIIPLNGATGVYESHKYFVYESVSRDLKSVVLNNTLHVSRDDLVNIAIQILTILQYLFERGMVLNNLTIDDFILRRTTRGYRVILLNQEFYTGELMSIDDTTFVSPSILHGNEPTMRDNVISAVYIMLYLINSTLPWIGKTEEEAESMKMDEVVMNMACGEEFRVLYEMLKKFNLHSTQIPQLDTYLDTLRSMTTKKNVTFGHVLSKYAKMKRVPKQEEEEKKEKEEEVEKKEEEEVKQKEEEIDKEEEVEVKQEVEEKKEEVEVKQEVEAKVEEEAKKEEEAKVEEEPPAPQPTETSPTDSELPPNNQTTTTIVMLLPKPSSKKREAPDDTAEQEPPKKHRLSAKWTWKERIQKFATSTTLSNLLLLSATFLAAQ